MSYLTSNSPLPGVFYSKMGYCIAGPSLTFLTKMVNYLLDCFSQVFNLPCLHNQVRPDALTPTLSHGEREKTALFLIFLLNRRQNPAQDVQLLAFRPRAREQTAQLVHHLARVAFADKTG